MTELNKLLDKIKETRSLASDNALAIALGVTRGSVSNWRHGKNYPDTVQCATIAGFTGEPLNKVLGIVGEARAISREEKAVWRRLAAMAAALALLVGAIPLPGHAEQSSQQATQGVFAHSDGHTGYYVRAARTFLTRWRLIILWLRWRFGRRPSGPDHLEAFAA